ncbi:type III restriction-modification system methyltransferase [methanotrophic bacterial endosymbiont of Bathymodiolus sp.]|nr:type III restriction-modification system methyltransferase [methanotrophic bacterial endosymbiont of Bathymodiolus sp.]
MQKSYHKQIKVIYIDPPYNTGKEFIYPDNYQDNLDTYLEYTGQKDSEGRKFGTNTETTGRYHTNWLNMMYPRLKLARNLLRDDGVIFISIDDNEAANLRKLCDEIFGEENFVSNVIWQSRTSISNDQEISLNHNHTLIYSKNREQLVFHGEPLNKSEYSNPDQDPRGPWKLVPIDANKPGGNTLYPIINPKTKNEYYPPNNRSWAMNSKDYQKLFDDGRIKFGMNDDSAPKKKLYLKERIEKGDSKTPSSILLNAGTTKSGTTELMDIFDGKKYLITLNQQVLSRDY